MFRESARTNNDDMRNYRDRNQNSIPFPTVGVRDVGPEHVVLAVHHLVHLFAVPQQLEVHETRLIPGKEEERTRREDSDISKGKIHSQRLKLQTRRCDFSLNYCRIKGKYL